MIAIALGLLGITFGLIESSSHPWASLDVAGPLVVGVILVVFFVLWESRTSSPMLPPSLLRAHSFVSGCGVYLLTYLALAGVMFYVTLLFQNVEGWSPFRTGRVVAVHEHPVHHHRTVRGPVPPPLPARRDCGQRLPRRRGRRRRPGTAVGHHVVRRGLRRLRLRGDRLGDAGARRRQRRHARCPAGCRRRRLGAGQRSPAGRYLGGAGRPRDHRGPCRHDDLGHTHAPACPERRVRRSTWPEGRSPR